MAIDNSRPPPDEIFYKTKKILYRGQRCNIILQDKNGPCPLIAICNVLILKHGINLDTYNSQVSEEDLVNLVIDVLDDTDEYIDIGLIRKLACGINVDLKFERITDFELTPELDIFRSLKIPLYHGWLVDPTDVEIVAAIGGRSRDELEIALTTLDTQTVSSVDFAASAEHLGLGKGDIEEDEMVSKALALSEMEASLKGSFDTQRVVSGSLDVNQISEDDTLVTSVDIEAGCATTLGSNICQLSKFDDQFSSTESEDCDVGNKTNVGEEVSSTELGDETFGDVETENSSKMTDVLISVEKTNLESTKNDIISEAITLVNADLSEKSQDDDVSQSVYEVQSLLGQSSPEGKGTKGLTQEEGELIKGFFEESVTQLTWHGLFTLEDDLKEWELCVLFRNNHFATMLQHEERLYTLVTYEGYQMQQDLVWERFNKIDGNSAFFTGYFTKFVFKDQQHAISKTENSISRIKSENMDTTEFDRLLALELEQNDWAGETGSEVPIISYKHISSSLQELKEFLIWQNEQSS
ncbi:putative MINDY deubiquitinase [Arabidopsis thaliana]